MGESREREREREREKRVDEYSWKSKSEIESESESESERKREREREREEEKIPKSTIKLSNIYWFIECKLIKEERIDGKKPNTPLREAAKKIFFLVDRPPRGGGEVLATKKK